ncbi:hypothetical protein [Cellulomonas sp. ICMP 17802]|uniref:hypothetical protein n=1 Tax=Cellulomonas sp. ICMP 17802 TaxID=3239199 RepID=UPI00351B3B0C
MSNVARRCTDPACAAQGKVQAGTTCAVCGKPTQWTVLRVPPPGSGPIAPIYSTPMPVARPVGTETRTCTNPGCARFHLAQDDPFCGACGQATVVATTT